MMFRSDDGTDGAACRRSSLDGRRARTALRRYVSPMESSK
jgi:hypothetical protein